MRSSIISLTSKTVKLNFFFVISSFKHASIESRVIPSYILKEIFFGAVKRKTLSTAWHSWAPLLIFFIPLFLLTNYK